MMGSSLIHFLVLLGLLLGASSGAAVGDQDVPQDNLNSVNESTDDVIQQVMGKECRGGYSPFCIKLGLMKLVNRGSGMTLAILPGVSISSVGVVNKLPTSASTLLSEPDKVDALLLDRLSEYIGSLSLNVKIMDKSAPVSFAKTYLEDNASSARRKNRFGGALAAAGLMSGGTLLAVALAALAAMAGKAMMASLLALMLSALAALKGNGGGEKTTYEVIAKPVVSHLHSHSSEVQHGHGHYRSMSGHHHEGAIHDGAVHDSGAHSAPLHDGGGHINTHEIVYAEQIPDEYQQEEIKRK